MCISAYEYCLLFFFSATWDVTPKTAGLTISSPSRCPQRKRRALYMPLPIWRFHKAVKKRKACITRPLQSNRAPSLNHNAVKKRQALITRPSQYCVQNIDIAPTKHWQQGG